MSELNWHDQAVIHGIQVKAFFFNGKAAKEDADLVRRALPMLAAAPVKPSVVVTEEDRKNFVAGKLVAQPDAVFTHGTGLVCVEYKSVGFRNHSRQKWQTEIRLADMLQALIGSYAVAQETGKLTACVLRYHNVAYLLVPTEALITMLVGLVPLAMTYYAETRRVAARQLAKFAVERVQSAYPAAETARMAAGRAAHESLLRRDDTVAPAPTDN